jgi:hypothetical protein
MIDWLNLTGLLVFAFGLLLFLAHYLRGADQ